MKQKDSMCVIDQTSKEEYTLICPIIGSIRTRVETANVVGIFIISKGGIVEVFVCKK